MKREQHGMTSTPIYSRWKAMKARCYNPNNKDYNKYNEMGIHVCLEWKESFTKFYEDVGDIPEPIECFSLERVDNTKGYYPDSVKWATSQEQTKNRSKPKDNSSGVTGVNVVHNKSGKSGYRAFWQVGNKTRSKFFSINKYGDELAFFAACECREQMIELLNKNGAGYGENHGK